MTPAFCFLWRRQSPMPQVSSLLCPFLGAVSFLHFPHVPSSHTSLVLPSLPSPSSSSTLCLQILFVETWSQISSYACLPGSPSLKALRSSFHLLKWLTTLQGMTLCSPVEELQVLGGGSGRPSRRQASPECSHIDTEHQGESQHEPVL